MHPSLRAVLAVCTVVFVASCGVSADGGQADGRSTKEPPISTTSPDGGGGGGLIDPTTTTGDDGEDETTTTEEGSEGDDELEAWAVGFCDNFSTWMDDVRGASTDARIEGDTNDYASAQAGVEAAFAEVSDATATLVAALDEGDAPPIDDGESLQDELVDRFQGFQDAVDVARSDVAALDPANPGAFQRGLSTSMQTFETEVQTIGDSFAMLDQRYPDPDLSAALDEACAGL